MAPQVDEMQLRIDELDTKMEKLKALYDQYFQGLERVPPTIAFKDVEKRLLNFQKTPPKSTVHRFRMQQLVQRWTTYNTYWTRILRQIEEGTFERDVRKARKKAEKLKAQDAPRQQAYELDEDDDFDPGALLGLEEVNTNAFDTEKPAPPPASTPAEVAFPPVPRAAPTGFSAPVPPAFGARPASQPGPPASQPGRPPAPRAPATTPANGIPVPPAAAPQQRIALPPVHTPRTAPAPGTARASVPPPAALASAPPAAQPPAPQAGGFALPPVHTPRVAPAPPPQRATTSQPGFALPPVHTPRVAVGTPQGPLGTPSTGRFPAVTPPAARPAAPVAPAAAAGGDDPAMRTLYQRYRDTRKTNGEGDVSYDTLARQVRDTLPKLAQKYPGHDVSLDVTVKDGKTILRPVVKAKK